MWSCGWNILQDITRSFVWELTINLPIPEWFRRYLSWELHSHHSWRSVPRICVWVFGRHKHGAGARTHQRIGRSLFEMLPSIFSSLFSKWKTLVLKVDTIGFRKESHVTVFGGISTNIIRGFEHRGFIFALNWQIKKITRRGWGGHYLSHVFKTNIKKQTNNIGMLIPNPNRPPPLYTLDALLAPS